MRWILVFLFLYIIPLVVLFRNYNNVKRAFIYASTYIVLMTTIVITNIYISGLNNIKDIVYYQNYSLNNIGYEKSVSNFDKEDELKKLENTEPKKINKDKEQPNIEKDKNLINQHIKSDKEIIKDFKKEIYEVETIALLPMRECLSYTQNISENIKNLNTVKEDVIYAQEKCVEVVDIYKNMEIPKLSDIEYSDVLDSAREDMKKAYELREKAMEASVNLVSTKNPKYIGKIINNLNLSDKQVENFKKRLNDLNEKIE